MCGFSPQLPLGCTMYASCDGGSAGSAGFAGPTPSRSPSSSRGRPSVKNFSTIRSGKRGSSAPAVVKNSSTKSGKAVDRSAIVAVPPSTKRSLLSPVVSPGSGPSPAGAPGWPLDTQGSSSREAFTRLRSLTWTASGTPQTPLWLQFLVLIFLSASCCRAHLLLSVLFPG